MARLTKKEQHLIDHPPTPKTWVCGRKYTRDGERVECDTPNAGHKKKCWYCAEPRRAKAELLWPAYLAACHKAHVEPRQERVID